MPHRAIAAVLGLALMAPLLPAPGAAAHVGLAEPVVAPGSGPVITPLVVSVTSDEPLSAVSVYDADGRLTPYGATVPPQPLDANGQAHFSLTIEYLPKGRYTVAVSTRNGDLVERQYTVIANQPYGFALTLSKRRAGGPAAATATLRYLSFEPGAARAVLTAVVERCRQRGRTARAGRRSCRAGSRRWRPLEGSARAASSSSPARGGQQLSVSVDAGAGTTARPRRRGLRYRARATSHVTGRHGEVLDSEERVAAL